MSYARPAVTDPPGELMYMDVRLRIVELQEQQLGHDGVGDLVGDLAPRKMIRSLRSRL